MTFLAEVLVSVKDGNHHDTSFSHIAAGSEDQAQDVANERVPLLSEYLRGEKEELSAVCCGAHRGYNYVFSGDARGSITSRRLENSIGLTVIDSLDRGECEIRALSLSDSGDFLMAGNEVGRVTRYVLGDGKVVEDQSCVATDAHPVRCIAILEVASTVVFSSTINAYVWNYRTETCKILPTAACLMEDQECLLLHSVKVSLTQVFALYGGRREVMCWNMPPGEEQISPPRALRGNCQSAITSISADEDDDILCGCTARGELLVWNTCCSLVLNEMVLPSQIRPKQLVLKGHSVFVLGSGQGTHHVLRIELNIQDDTCWTSRVVWDKTLSEFYDVHQLTPLVEEGRLLLVGSGKEGPLMPAQHCLMSGIPVQREVPEEFDLNIVEEQDKGKAEDMNEGIDEGIDEDMDEDLEQSMVGSMDKDSNAADEGNGLGDQGLRHGRGGLYVGKKFGSRAEAIKFVEEFSKKSQAALFCRSSGGGKERAAKGELVYECRHGQEAKSRSKGVRTRNHTIKKNCGFQLRFYTGKSGSTKLTKIRPHNPQTDHNHRTTRHMFQQDTGKATPGAIAVISQLLEGKCLVSNMRKALAKKNIFMTSAQIRYQVRKIQGAPLNAEDLQTFLDGVEQAGGSAKVKRDTDGKVQAIAITTEKMRKAYVGASPEVVQMDNSFGMETSNYKFNR